MNETDIIRQPAHARCYKCGEVEISGICHHCGRAICAAHLTQPARPLQLGLQRALAVQMGFKKLSDPEFAGYELDEAGELSSARLSLRDELVSGLRLAHLVNPEFQGYVHDLPPQEESGLSGFAAWKKTMQYRWELLNYRWNHIRRRIGLAWGKEVGYQVPGQGHQAIHCEHCAHLAPTFEPTITFGRNLALLFFGLALLVVVLNGPVFHGSVDLLVRAARYTGLVILLGAIGLGLMALGFWLNQRFYIQSQCQQLGPLPLDKKEPQAQVNESIRGQIVLNHTGEYDAQAEPPNCKLTVEIGFDDSYRRGRDYQTKLDDLRAIGGAPAAHTLFNAGYLVLGPANWEFEQGEIWSPGRVNVVELRESLEDEKLSGLLTEPDMGKIKWAFEHEYRLIPDPDDTKPVAQLPVMVVVSIQPKSDRHTLDIELALSHTLGIDLNKKPRPIIEQLSLWLPNALGAIEHLDPQGRIDPCAGERPNLPGECQSITWKNLDFNQQPFAFSIQFQNKIDPDTRLEGKLAISVPTALSGIQQVRFYRPYGDYAADIGEKPFKAQASINVDLDIDLSALRYQEMKAVSDTIKQEGVVPESRLVAEIADLITRQGFYVKRITENPPRTSKEGAHKINRFWDIFGRKYEGVYPIDFHLVLTGEEVRGRGSLGAGRLTVEYTVQGAVTNEDMAERLENVSQHLGSLVRECVLKSSALVQERQSLPAPDSTPFQAADEISVDAESPTRGTPVEVMSTAQPGVEVLRPIIVEDRLQKVESLQRKLDLLEERFLEGKVSEDTYLDMKSKYEQELWEQSDGTLGQPAGKSSRRRMRK